ncbi:polyprenyl synthetase family protein [Kitasatospora sp. NPDC059327]|uniref:polyprenyl synthetase family protein n=1 Tax=Kitasatospora sp. NPDC059327 TaxID=3346803 RepID=UPI0036C360E3
MTLPLPASACEPSAFPDPRRFAVEVEELLRTFLARKAESTTAGGRLPNLADPIQELLEAGGKRIRPILALTGWHAAGATGDRDTTLHLAASLELFHAFALIQDDVMDRSVTRRGRPTVHQTQTARSERRIPAADRTRRAAAAARFGEGAAILIGDLALLWSDELFRLGHPTQAQLGRVEPLLTTMRFDAILGQYLDLDAATHLHADVESALSVIRHKAVKYTVEAPLQMGAALAGADQALMDALSAYAAPLGEAYQLRDDLLGVFGAPERTGKPVLDDLREGTATVLITVAFDRATRAQRDLLHRYLGCSTLTQDQADEARRVIEATGARHTVERMITDRYEQVLTAMDDAPFEAPVADALRRLAAQVVQRAA